MATPAQRTNPWILDEWYDQAVAGTQGDYQGAKEIWVWGNPNEGALGLNDQVARSSPCQLPAGPGTNQWTSFVSGWVSDHSGNQTMFAIKNNTELWGWGMNERGEIPINTNDSYSSPKQIPGSWDKVYQTKWGGAGFKTDGSLWTWGDNIKGQLGQGQKPSTVFGYSSPVQVPGSWSSLRPDSANAMLAFKTDGTLWGWGDTSYGALGQNTSPQGGTERFSSPVQILGTWSNVGGGGSVLLRKSNGELWVQGSNNKGQLGQNNTIQRSSPVQLGTDTTWTDNVFSNGFMSGGVKTDGTMWIWGQGDNGSFGLNHRETIAPGVDYVSSPVQLPGSWPGVLNGSIAQGSYTTYFMKNL